MSTALISGLSFSQESVGRRMGFIIKIGFITKILAQCERDVSLKSGEVP